METSCWVNIFHGLYADCTDGLPYYISPGYATQKEAIDALGAPKTKSILNRYITTTELKFEITMRTLNEHVQLFNTLEGASSFFTRACISGGKPGRLLVLTNPTGKLDFVVDLTPNTKEQVHVQWPQKYTVLKTKIDVNDMSQGAIKVESLGDFVNIADYGTHMTIFLQNGGKPVVAIVLEPATIDALTKFLNENKRDES